LINEQKIHMRLKEYYQKEIRPALTEKFHYPNRMAVPKLCKVVINVGFGRQAKEKAQIDKIAGTLEKISGQKPVLTKARKSISAFKVREGMVIGAKVTLRGQRMFDFTEKLVKIVFARVRDFRGLPKELVDRTGSMTVGLKEHIAFPEIKADEIDSLHGLEICFFTTAKNAKEGQELFRLLGFPFKM